MRMDIRSDVVPSRGVESNGPVRNRTVLGLIFRDGRCDRLEPGDVLLMRSDFDVVVVARDRVLLRQDQIQQAVGVLDELRRASREQFEA
jgi:hypothetical protein